MTKKELIRILENKAIPEDCEVEIMVSGINERFFIDDAIYHFVVRTGNGDLVLYGETDD